MILIIIFKAVGKVRLFGEKKVGNNFHRSIVWHNTRKTFIIVFSNLMYNIILIWK